jgi:hypothetical protein
MKKIIIIPLVLLTLFLIVVYFMYNMSINSNNDIPDNYVIALNSNTSFKGKLSKNYAHSDVRGVNVYDGSKVNATSSNVSSIKETNRLTSGVALSNKVSSTATKMSSQSANDAYSTVSSTGQTMNSDNYTQSVHPSISGRFRPVSIVSVNSVSANNAIASTDVSVIKNNSKPLQKAGDKPGEPGLGTLPVGDGMWILLLLTLIYGGWRYLRF